MPNYCRNNVICLNESCKFLHYKSIEERKILNDMYLEIPEEDKTKNVEMVKKGQWTCRYHLLCFERDCTNNHSGLSLDGRKILIKMFKTYNKHEKARIIIEKDIESIRNGEKRDWADM